jgi:hypothetical protein
VNLTDEVETLGKIRLSGSAEDIRNRLQKAKS